MATGIVLQLASTGTVRKAAFGSFTITFTGAVSRITTLVTHNLGVVPSCVLAMANRPTGQVSLVCDEDTAAGAPTTTQVNISAITFNNTNPVNGTVYTVYWLALG